jgi:hypothetical protein
VANPVTGITVLIIEVIMLVMNFVFMADFLKSREKTLVSDA